MLDPPLKEGETENGLLQNKKQTKQKTPTFWRSTKKPRVYTT